jgi:UDPglucose 6-dehydrogenase
MNIGIVGQGFVGNAIYQKFKNYFKVFTYDLSKDKCNATQEEVFTQKIIFVCLPTPMNLDGSCNVELVEETIKGIAKIGKSKIVVIKSTVSPGTTARLNSLYPNLHIVFNPEFLTEVNAVEDFNNQNRIILGGPRPATTKLKTLYRKAFPQAHIVKTGSTHAEMVKYVTNTFLATKVAYANEIYEICEGLKLDYDKVIEYATFDKRLGKSHWAVPGPDGDFGFGGHCFPKDLRALITLSENLDIHPLLLLSVEDKNEKVRNNKDWLYMKGRAVV